MKKVFVLLMVCLMVTTAANASRSWVGPSGSWGTAALWQASTLPSEADGEIKILRTGVTSCTLDVAAGTFTTTKVTLGGASQGSLTLNVVDGGSIFMGKEIVVGSGSGGGAGPVGTIVQTGGTITLNNAANTASGKLELGYKSGSTGVGQGFYTISGGTLNGSGGIYVGTGAGTGGATSGTIGTFKVIGAGTLEAPMTVSVGGPLFVATGDATGFYDGTGTLAFEVVDGELSAINAGSVYIDPANHAATIANLIVTLTGAAPTGDILLVNNTGTIAVAGVFDNVTIPAGYAVSYVYDAGTMTNGAGNDVALVVIPEPATIALLSIGLLAIRRNRK